MDLTLMIIKTAFPRCGVLFLVELLDTTGIINF